MNISLENQTLRNSSSSVRGNQIFGFVTFLGIVVIVLPIGIVGNLLVITVVWKKRVIRTNTNLLLANLAGSDLLACVLGYTVAITRYFPPKDVTLGLILCRINSFFPAASLCSILTLTIIAIERYNGLVRPLRPGFKFRKRALQYFCVLIWIISLASVTPLIYFDEYNPNHRCTRSWRGVVREFYWTWGSVICVGVPLLIIIFCYVCIIRALYFGLRVIPMNIPLEMEEKEKRKVIKLAVIVTLVFALSFLPFTVVRGMEIRGPVPYEVSVSSLILVLLSSIFNPFIYAFQSTNYRRAFREVITCRL